MDIFQQMPNEKLLEAFIPKEAAYQLLAEHRSIYNAIMDTTEKELLSIKTLGSSRIRRIQCLRELVLRLQNETRRRITVLRSPQDAATYLADMQNLQQEQFRVLALNCKNGLIVEKIIAQGTINASLISPREVFHIAIRNMAASIVIAHNHPSGDSNPSKEDMDVTNELVKAGYLMKIPVQDHIIIGKSEFYSFRENGHISDNLIV